MNTMTSRERLLAALRRQPVDYAPCSPFFNPLSERLRVGHRYQFPFGPSQAEMVPYAVETLGVDPVVVSAAVHQNYPAAGVSSRVWMDGKVIHKAWRTPGGEMRAAINYNEHWPHGLDIPLFSDFNVAHFAEPWLKTEQDLACLRHILQPAWHEDHLAQLRFQAREARTLAEKHRLATWTQIGMGLTGAQHLFGAQPLCLMVMENPELVQGYLELEHALNRRAIELAVDLDVDILSRNGFYETADIYSPAMLENFLGKPLREEIHAAHQAGKAVAYTANVGVMPMLDYLERLDFDCIFGIDLTFRGTDLRKIKEKLGGRKSFWMGPASQAHIYADTEEPTRQAVREVFAALGKTGLILAPSVSSHSIMPWHNTLAMIDEWKRWR